MPSYRVDFIDRTNRISRPAEIVEYAGDLETIQKAKQFMDGHDVELWEKVALSCDFLTTRENSKGLLVMLSTAQKKRAERLFQWKQDGVKALSEHETREQATRLLTAKLRAERLAREATSGKRDGTKAAKASPKSSRSP